MPSTDRLNEIIRNYTVAYRKDAEVIKEKDVGNVHVVEIMGYPQAPSHGELVDVHFIKIGFTEASADQDAFLDAFDEAVAGTGEFGVVLTKDDFHGGPSYITVGGWLGSQDQALRLFALFAHYGLGDVITPATLHMTGEQADQAAGMGLVMGLFRKSEPVGG